MQTFLPLPSVQDSIRLLRPDELDQIIYAATTVLNVLHETVTVEEYDGHPEVFKWRGHEPFLAEFGLASNQHLSALDKADGILMSDNDENGSTLEWHMSTATSGKYSLEAPKWFGDIAFHQAEQSKLVRLEPTYYRNCFPTIDMLVPEVWPRA